MHERVGAFPLHVGKSFKGVRWCRTKNHHGLRAVELARSFHNSTKMATTYENSDSMIGSSNGENEDTGVVGLTSSAVREETTVEEYTQFTDSALTRANPPVLVDTHVDDVEDTATIISFLKRPALIYSENILSSTVRALDLVLPGWVDQPYIKEFSVPKDTLNAGNKLQKIANFQWFKFDTVFRIQTTVNPFIAGKLWVCFAPYDSQIDRRMSILHKSMAGITAYPGVEIDLSSSNTAEVRVPWSGLGDAFDLCNNDFSLGSLFIFALTPILRQGDVHIPIQVYSWFDNISLNGPTPMPVRLQVAREAKGPIEKVSSTIGKVAGALSVVPGISAESATVSWFANMVSGVASTMGWSRPVEGSHAKPIVNVSGRGYTHFTAKDSSVILGMSNENAVAEDEHNFLQADDEMSMEHICGRPSCIDNATWASQAPVGTVLGQYAVSVKTDGKRATTWSAGNVPKWHVYGSTLFETVGSYFGLWKADLHFRISFVRTPFHMGRVEVFFVPGVDWVNPGPAAALDSTNLYRHILDLSETNEVHFTVPYQHARSMMSNGTSMSSGSIEPGVGTIIVRVVSPLNAPDTVSNKIHMTVWKWASNVVFACPLAQDSRVPPAVITRATLQGNVKNEEKKIESVVFGQLNDAAQSRHAAIVVGGEACVSLRQATRSHRLRTGVVNSEDIIRVIPREDMNGYVGLASTLFAFYRGGLSIKLFPASNMTINSRISTRLIKVGFDRTIEQESPEHFTCSAITPFHEIQVPYYSAYRRSLTNYFGAGQGNDQFEQTKVKVYANEGEARYCYIGGKDDLTFGYLIGPTLRAVPITQTRLLSSEKPIKMTESEKEEGYGTDTVDEPNMHRAKLQSAGSMNPDFCNYAGTEESSQGLKPITTKLRKRVSYILRHDQYVWRVEGGVDIRLLAKMCKSNELTILTLIDTDNKQRFALKNEYAYARWGHSIGIPSFIETEALVDVAYHSTIIAAKSSIERFGILKMKRDFVHMSATRAGTRFNRPVVYEIDIEKLKTYGEVWQTNDILLAPYVPVSCIKSVTIYGRKFDLWKRANLQGLSDYNPLGLIADMRSATKSFTGTSEAIHTFADQGQKILAMVSETMENAKATLFGAPMHGIVTKVFKILCNALMCDRKYLAANLLFNVSMEFGSQIYSKIQSVLGLSDDFPVVLQSGGMISMGLGKIGPLVDSHRGLCAAGLGTLLAVIFQCSLGLPFSGKTIDQVITFFGMRARGLKNMYDFAAVTMPLFTAIGGYLVACQFGSEVPELDEYLTGYHEWSENVMNLVVDQETTFAVRLEKDVKLFFQVDKLYRKSIEYASLINTKGIRGPALTHYQKLSKIVEELKRLCDYTGVFGNRPRVKPLVVQLFGESGVGKSGMSWPLACDLNGAFTTTREDAQNFASEIYFRNTEQEFWDGYAGQNIVVYDDFGQRVDTMNAPNEEFMELIRAANVAPYPLHMADLPEKKRTKFCSKAIILTSNVLELNVSSLTFPDAYRRRIDVCGKVLNKEEYTKESFSHTTGEIVARLDPMKCDGPVDTSPYLIELYDPESQQPICVDGRKLVMEYEEFLEYCLEKAQRSFKNSRAMNSALGERMTDEHLGKLRARFQGRSIFSLEDNDKFWESLKIPSVDKKSKDESWLLIASDIATGYKERLKEMFTIKNGLILAGLALAGVGAWKLLKTNDVQKKHHIGFGYVSEATSGDNRTKKNKIVKHEVTSGDNLTKKTKMVLHEAIRGANNKEAEQMLEAFSSSDNRTKISRRATVESCGVEMQVWKDASAQDLITHRIISNMYKIIRIRESGETPLLNGLFVRDTIMLAPKHLMLELREEDTIRIENALGASFTLPVKILNISEVQARQGFHKDAVLIQFPRYVNAHSDLVKHFQTMPELACRRVDVCVPTLRSINTQNCLTILGNTRAEFDSMILDTEIGALNIRDVIRYNLNTRDGDCGAPVICQENTMIRKIAGIHIAALADGSVAIGQSVTQADLLRAIEKFQNVVKTDNDDLPGFVLKKFEAKLQLEVNYTPPQLVEYCGSIAESFGFSGYCDIAPFAPNKSDIQPSVIHGLVTTPITKPSCLYSAEENVMEKNMKKNAINTVYIPKDEVARCANEVKCHLLKNRDKKLARILTYEEAIAGSEDSMYISSLNRASSAGFPWVLHKKSGTHGKTGWFGKDEYVFDESVRFATEARISAARQGIRVPTVWTDTLKDERRPIDKVDARKTRVFANGPMDYTIAFRQYFLGFIAHIMENRIVNEQSLGTNPYGMDWTLTAKKLSKFGERVFAGDFSSFDGTLNSCIMEGFVEMANEFYNDGEENAMIRRVFFLDVFNSIHLCQKTFIYLTHSQPSGNPVTTALNSYYNSVSMRIAYYRAAVKAEVLPPQFDDAVSMISYGDDNVVNFSSEVAAWFNQQTVTEAYATFGMIYTDEAKSDKLVPKWRSLQEIAYLKRGFRQVGPIWRAPMDLNTILETPNWVRRSPDDALATKDNVEDSIRELAQHERAVYDKWSSQFITTFYEVTGDYPTVFTYDTYNEEWNREMGLIH